MLTSLGSPDPAMPGEQKSGPPYFVIASIGIAAVVMVAGLLRWRQARVAP